MKFIPTAVVAAMAAAAFSTSVQAEALLSFEGHSYFLTPNASTWDEAEAQAVAMGGHLVAINSAAEDAALSTVSAFNTRTTWIGLNDIDVEGQFVWTNGDALTYTHWRPGEPNNRNNEDRVERYFSGQWNDYQADGVTFGIVEISAVPEPGTQALLLAGMAGLAAWTRRRLAAA